MKIDRDKLDMIVLKIMLKKEDYRKLPDYHVKEICYEAIIEYIKEEKNG